jgi:hypothetical protein
VDYGLNIQVQRTLIELDRFRKICCIQYVDRLITALGEPNPTPLRQNTSINRDHHELVIGIALYS